MAMMDIEQVELANAEPLWGWLDAHHTQEKSVWLVTWKPAHPGKYVSRDQVLEALLAHGGIDGRRKVLDADRTMQLIAPRRQQAWSQSYKNRVARLEQKCRMHPAGVAKVSEGRASGLWASSAPGASGSTDWSRTRPSCATSTNRRQSFWARPGRACVVSRRA